MKYDFQSEKLTSRVVAIGGGTGLSTMLRGLKKYFENITAVVTVADDGGGSGMLRRDLGVAPPGDVRNCILAMAEAEPVLKMCIRDREDLDGLSWRAGTAGCTPVFLRGTFEVDKKADTFLRLDGFSKGQCYINGFLLGRYWNTAGPQKTLYLPSPLLKEGENELVVLELDSFDRPCVTLTDEPDLG